VSEVADRYRRVADGFSAKLAGVGTNGWSSPSPCDGWSARDVTVHVIRTTASVRGLLGDDGPEVDADGDLVAQWAARHASVEAALADPSHASTELKSGFGNQTFESLVGRLLCSDTLVHTWDLARATGQDERLDPAAVAAALGMLEPLDETLRRPGGFAPKRPVAAGADDQTRLLAFCGRDPKG
jgi:uncharacterized protein (TIGR03086 family)